MQKRAVSSKVSGGHELMDSDVDLMQNLTSIFIISSCFLITDACIRVTCLVISHKSLTLALVSFASCQLIAAAVPAAVSWVSAL